MGGGSGLPAPSLLDLPHAPDQQYADKPEYGHVNAARLGGGYPPKLKAEAQEEPQALQRSHGAGRCGHTPGASVQVPGREQLLRAWHLQSEGKAASSGVRMAQLQGGRAPRPPISGRATRVTSTTGSAQAGHARQSEGAVTMATAFVMESDLLSDPCALTARVWLGEV